MGDLSKNKQAKLRELELQRGGVAFVSERTKATSTPTVVISLGGLGGKVLNTLKGKFIREVGECDHVFFRMIDTSKDDMEKLCRVQSDGKLNPLSNANMERVETISIYQTEMAELLKEKNIPAYIKNWIHPSLIGKKLDDTGAQQTRQIGRAMLVNNMAYDRIKQQLKTLFANAWGKRGNKNDHINIMIIAGISGGTGSGTIIDLSYMIRNICEQAKYNNLIRIGAFIFTPDAQFLEQGIADSQYVPTNLKNNGYAALKEIDYFMNIEENKAQYKLELDNGEIIISNKNIFDTCTLISGASEAGGYNELTETIGRLTDQMLDMLTNISFTDKGGQTLQLGDSILSNQSAMMKTWFMKNQDRKLYHRYATYKYQVLGYHSIMIPRDEILAYCVNKIYERVLTEFNNLSLVNKNMMKEIYRRTNVLNSGMFEQYAVTINDENSINRTVSIDGITKSMIKDNPMVGYEYACEACQDEVLKINSSFQTVLEEQLFDALKRQVDQVFEQYGPYVAMKAIEHTHDELNVGNSNEPFPGIIEMLVKLSNKFTDLYNEANHTYRNGGQQEILNAAEDAIGLHPFSGSERLNDYMRICCEQAAIAKIDTRLFKTLSDVLYNVSQKMNSYNNVMFNVYTSILTEIQEILNKDGQYFTKGRKTTENHKTTFSIDIIKNGEKETKQLEQYLNAFISKVSVHDLAQAFINDMKEKKEKWLAEEDENHFDVVNEVRQLMDRCLISNKMKDDIIEKFVVAAYSSEVKTPEELDAVWDDNSSDGFKMQALSTAAQQIYNLLTTGGTIMANTASGNGFVDYEKEYYITTLNETPQLSGILNGMIAAQRGYNAAQSTSKNKFIIMEKYKNLPMYILAGMKDYNSTYITMENNHGVHMDENNQDWRRFPNPYTIDSVALSLNADGKAPQEIEEYEDYKTLVKVKKQTEDATDKYHFIEYQDKNMILYDINSYRVNMEEFKGKLCEEVKKQGEDFELIPFMKNNGFIFRPETISTGDTDIDLTLTSFDSIDMNNPRYMAYKDVPVPIPDLYKWMRKSMKYMDILDKNTKLFEELQEVIDTQLDEIKEEERLRREKEEKEERYRGCVVTFAYAIRTGMVSQNQKNKNIWEYRRGTDPAKVNLALASRFEKEYYLYSVFADFYAMDDSQLQKVRKRAESKIMKGDELDCDTISFITDHIKLALDEDHLGDDFNFEEINKLAKQQAAASKYELTDLEEDKGNPAKILERFYILLDANME